MNIGRWIMKKTFLFLLVIILFAGCSENKTSLKGTDTDFQYSDTNSSVNDTPLPNNDDNSIPDEKQTDDVQNDIENDDPDNLTHTDEETVDYDNGDIPAKICEPGEKQCSDDEKRVYTCKDDGLEWLIEECEKNYYCDSGSLKCEELYVISIDDGAEFTRLLKISVVTGEGIEICKTERINGYNSSTFTRESILYLSRTGYIDRMDPNTCEITEVGATGFKAVPGITSNYENGIYGVANNNNDEGKKNKFLDIDIDTAEATVIGDLGSDFGTTGATWCEELKIVYSINGSDDKLYEIDRTTGTATYLVDLVDDTGAAFDFGSVGIELHPLNGEIYACSGVATELLHIDPVTGTVTKIGTGMGHEKTDCDNLGAPWKNVIKKQ
ncbi:MAG: hypothetical protein RBT87_02450 [bacterium]|jgi:hypothetical protein|nr:hypothetical protein [bacterium]